MRSSAGVGVLGLAAFLVAGIVAPFCAPVAASAAMPCCETSARCDFGMKASGCCRIDPVPAASQTVALQAPAAKSPSKHRLPGAVLQAAQGGSPAIRHLLRMSRVWSPPLHDSAPPIYLLNAAILR
ncbi:MAG: hypothetical protein HY510_04870 [Acidobacteria bacterium]|nr:hypothetical protein [Acidobacteriota bacterium]